jgi:hypothetical protein
MSQPRLHGVSAGKRAGTARPIPKTEPWWAHQESNGAARRSGAGVASMLPHLGEAGRADRHERGLAAAAEAIQAAPDAAEVFAALGSAVEHFGLNGHVAALEAGERELVVKSVALPWAALGEVERLLGHSVVGARLRLDEVPPYASVVRSGRSERVDEPMWWARLAVPGIEPTEARVIGRLIRLGDVVLAPILTDGRVFGVLTVWSSELSGATASTAELLGRMAGSALAALDRAPAAWRGGQA